MSLEMQTTTIMRYFVVDVAVEALHMLYKAH